MLDPTMFRKAQESLEAIKQLAGAVQKVKVAFLRAQQAFKNTIERGDSIRTPEELANMHPDPKPSEGP